MSTDHDYIQTDPFFPDESDIKCRRVELRKARKEHLCWGLTGQMDHAIKVGERHRYERAFVDGEFGEFRMCFSCMDKFISGDY